MLKPHILTAPEALAAEPAVRAATLRRLRPTSDQLKAFRGGLRSFLGHLSPKQLEDEAKGDITNWLGQVLAAASSPPTGRYINKQGNRDLVIHLGSTADTPVGVLVEVKAAKYKGDMISPASLNHKAFHELLLYYLEDREAGRIDRLCRLVITTGFEWYFFDALAFNELFWENPTLKAAFKAFKNKATAADGTDHFYKAIGPKTLEQLTQEIKVVRVELTAATPDADDRTLRDLWRLFHPAYLLKEEVATRPDPNTLNTGFYLELLHLMGLHEVKASGGVRKIERLPVDRREPGSLLENTLNILETGHGLAQIPEPDRLAYGDTPDAQRYGVALALCLRWVNRLLFLKLLEGQLVRYHVPEHAAHFRFLAPVDGPLTDYDDVNALFLEVLNRPVGQRRTDLPAAFREVPYLNSSLFEASALEMQTLYLSGLRNGLGLAPFATSVLRARAGRSAPALPPGKGASGAGQWQALPYLLHFLDAYDFASDPTAQADPDPATTATPAGPHPEVISAAVLGLVFEKINGYEDGSFYTPGFVTQYIAAQTLGPAVVQHFQRPGSPVATDVTGVESSDDLAFRLSRLPIARRRAAAPWFNRLTVLDPAVGSGHFLVSALNELLALKCHLGLLFDDDGKDLSTAYSLHVEHDELVVQDRNGDPAPYRVAAFDPHTGQRTVGAEATRLQSALFREKRALMEHALYGVDLNPNSVGICRLRLWIELLKNAYYRPVSGFRELETLPNLDLNVRTGNSLLKRFPLDQDLADVFRRPGTSLVAYRDAVTAYFGATGADDKSDLNKLLASYRDKFRLVVEKRDSLRLTVKKLRDKRDKLEGDTELARSGQKLFAETDKQREAREDETRRTIIQLEKAEKTLADRERALDARRPFEWRFEFPEVLSPDGAFAGFDVIIGNPPYIKEYDDRRAFDGLHDSPYYEGKMDLWYLFACQALDLLRSGGWFGVIATSNWGTSAGATKLRHALVSRARLRQFIDFGDYQVFESAAIQTMILLAQKDRDPAAYVFEGRFLAQRHATTPDALALLTATPTSAGQVRALTLDRAAVTGQPLTFSADDDNALLDKIAAQQNFFLREKAQKKLGVKAEVGQGIVAPQDKLDGSGAEKLPGARVGEGIFNLSLAEAAALSLNAAEIKLLRPFYTTQELGRYYGHPAHRLWVIYTGKKHSRPGGMHGYPALQAHFDRFRSVITSSNAPYGLHRQREEHLFKGEKIIVQRKCPKQPVFTYTDFPCYVSQTHFVIQSARINLKYLTGLLNSSLVAYWLRHRGKMQGHNYQVDKGPIMAIPILLPAAEAQAPIIALVEQLLVAKAAAVPDAATIEELEIQLNKGVADLYGLSEAEQERLVIGAPL